MAKTKKVKAPKIKPLEGYTAMSDPDVVHRGTAVQTGMTGNSSFPTPPVDLAALKTNIESFSALISEALYGSKKVIAQKDKQREAVIKMLRLLGRYVEVQSNGDMAIFTSSGFQAASTAKVPPAPLSIPVIKSADHGVLSGEIVVQVHAIPKALHYEIRYGAQVNGGPPSSWTSKVVTKRIVEISGVFQTGVGAQAGIDDAPKMKNDQIDEIRTTYRSDTKRGH